MDRGTHEVTGQQKVRTLEGKKRKNNNSTVTAISKSIKSM